MTRRLTQESARIFSEILTSTQMVLGFVSANYPAGELGILLFKSDCQRFGMTKQLEIIENAQYLPTKYKITIAGDAKGKNHKFGLISVSGEPLYCGHFLENKLQPTKENNGDLQQWSEVHALLNAIRLCEMFCHYKGINPIELTLHYLTDSQIVENIVNSTHSMTYYSHKIRALLKETGIKLKIDWIRGVDNMADRYTLIDGEIVHPNFQMMERILEFS